MKLSAITRRALRGPHSLKGYFRFDSLALAPVLAPGVLEGARSAARDRRRTRAGLLRDFRVFTFTNRRVSP